MQMVAVAWVWWAAQAAMRKRQEPEILGILGVLLLTIPQNWLALREAEAVAVEAQSVARLMEDPVPQAQTGSTVLAWMMLAVLGLVGRAAALQWLLALPLRRSLLWTQ
jgi:hypothetical protein